MDAVAVGSLYALIALGYTMVYGILKFINFAHSDIFVLGAWVSYMAALCGGWVDVDPGAAGLQMQGVAHWVLWVMVGISVAAALSGVYEKVVLRGADAGGGGVAARLPRTRLFGPVALVAVWGWGCIGLLYVARAIKGVHGEEGVHTASDVAAGGVVLLLAMAACGLVGFTLERLAYKPLRKAPRLNVLITAIGVSLFLENLGQLDWMFGTRPQRMPTLLPDIVLFRVGNAETGVPIRLVDVMVIVTAVVLMVVLDWLVFRTKMGRAMRAVSFNPPNASLMGIDVDKVISFTFVLGAALAAAAGFLYGQKYPGLNQTAAAGWVLLGLKAFVAAVIGGIGNIRGAMLGGLLIGVLEFFGTAYLSPALRDVYVFSVLILVLLFKPSGILGKAVTEKV